MKKTAVITLMLVFVAGCAPCAFCMNVLMENQKLKNELQNTAANQSLENSKWIMYYKGKPNYAGASYGVSPSAVNYANTSSSSSSTKKDIYTKKGVKFKLKNEDKIKILKEQKRKDEEKSEGKKIEEKDKTSNVKYSSSASQKSMTRETSVKTTINSKSQDKKIHNADAE